MNHRSPNFQHVANLAATMAEDSFDGDPPRVTKPIASGQFRLDRLTHAAQLRDWLASGEAQMWRAAFYPVRARAAEQLQVSDRQLARWESRKSFPHHANSERYYKFCEKNRRRYVAQQQEEQGCPPPSQE